MFPYHVIFLINLIATFIIIHQNSLVNAGKDSFLSECFASSTDFDSFQCYPSRIFLNDLTNNDEDEDDDEDEDIEMIASCIDSDERCPEWSEKDECQRNPQYMLVNCRKSCGTCVNGHAGTTQVIPDPSLNEEGMKKLLQTAKYMYDLTSRNIKSHKSCYNSDPMCTYWAIHGKCKSDAETMKQKCAATCQFCK